MGRGAVYDEALREAQEAGYAEADPSFDVDGRDAAQKLAILASVAWGTVAPRVGRGRRPVSSDVTSRPGETSASWPTPTEGPLPCRPCRLDPTDPLAGADGHREHARDRSSGRHDSSASAAPVPAARVTAGAVYGDLARLVAGERPILCLAR